MKFGNYKEVENPNYDRNYKKYEKDLAKYEKIYAEFKEKLKEWEKQKDIYDKGQKKKMFERLKKELGE